MIGTKTLLNICSDLKNVENYSLAVEDKRNFWHLHHRYETHDKNGYILDMFVPVSVLKTLKLYYHRPATELIFLLEKDHNQLHHKVGSYYETEVVKKVKKDKYYKLKRYLEKIETPEQKKEKFIRCKETDKLYKTYKEAATDTKTNSGYVKLCCLGKIEKPFSFTFEIITK